MDVLESVSTVRYCGVQCAACICIEVWFWFHQ